MVDTINPKIETRDTAAFINHAAFSALDTYNQLAFLCLLGHLAPSSHNTQPWRFLINKQTLQIIMYLERKFVLPASDEAGRQAVISLGCALENIFIGAAYYGYTAAIDLAPIEKTDVLPAKDNQPSCVKIATINFSHATPQPELHSTVKAIFDRKVIRAEFDPTKTILEKDIAAIQQFADQETTQFHAVTDSLRRLGVAEFQAQADGFVINSSKFSKELGDWLLPNDTDSLLGMPGIGFGLQDDEAARLHNGLVGAAALRPEDGLKFAASGKIFIEKSPLIGIITTKQDDPLHWIAAGRLFEKIFLFLTEQNIQVAIHAGITEVSLIKKIFSMTLGTTRHTTVLFRAGYVKNEADTHRPFSPRLPLSSVLLTDTP